MSKVYTLFDRDSGNISQSNIVYSDENGAYGRILEEREQTFIGHDGSSYANFDRQYVNNWQLADRPHLGITIDRTAIGANEHVVLRGIPPGVILDLFVVIAGRKHLTRTHSIADADIGVPFDTPGLYAIAFRKHPYVTWETLVEVSG